MKEYFALFNSLDSKGPFSLCTMGVTFADPNYHIAKDERNTTGFEYVISGRGTIICNGKKYYAKAGDTFFLPCGCNYEYYSDKNDPWVKIWINCFGNLMPKMMFLYQLDETILFSGVTIYHIFKKILKVCKSTITTLEEKEVMVSLLLHELIINLYMQSTEERKQSVAKFSDAHIIKAYLDNHINDKVRACDLAALIYKSPSQITRIFKNAYGTTPNNYLMEMRVASAQRLLEQTNLSIKEIAFKVGFSSEHYFSHLFKARTGISPTAYKDSVSK